MPIADRDGADFKVINKRGIIMLTEILKIIAPGTPLREGLDNILKAKTGALIVIGDSKEIMDIVDRRL